MNYTKTLNFIKRDFIIESSYKLNFILSFLNSCFPVLSLFFVGKLIEGNNLPALGRHGGEYFPFALIGIAFARFFQIAVDTFSGNIKRAQMAGCLEAILSSQTNPKSVVVMSSFYSFFSAGVQLVFMFLVGYIFLGFNFSNTNVPATIFALITSLIAFISLGILAAAGTVIFKQGEPISWLFGAVSSLLGGAMFPVEVLPPWLQFFSYLFPITHSLEALRLAVLQGYSIHMIVDQLIVLTLMASILFPLSLKAFHWAVEKGKRDGTLMQY